MSKIDIKVDPMIAKLLDDIAAYLRDFDREEFIKAFEFAKAAHAGQMRKQNIPYITHPVETVKILTGLRADEITLIAALLHDVPEDTEKTIGDVEEAFGQEVSFLVEGITKLSKVYYRHNMEVRQIESLKKLLLHSAKDPRVVLIKLADRLHNMRTLQYIDNTEKRIRIARETLEIYVPIANLLGIAGIKAELEDLCFKNILPKEFEALKHRVSSSQKKHHSVLEKMMRMVHEALEKEHIHAELSGRQKTLYSIYKKMISEGKSIAELDDRIALRIIAGSRDECYVVLGLIHEMFKPKPSRFKDYIALPKNNGYRSIHTTVFGVEGVVTEFQIRTMEMHIDAEYGIAAHYFYKGETDHKSLKHHVNWAQKILEIQKEQIADRKFLENLKLDIFQDRIFVFTPKGDVIDLPRGATGVDFAYAIHSHLGHAAQRMEINGENFPLTTVIPSGATINIISSKKAHGPNRNWLGFARTQYARQRIREYFKKQDKDKKVSLGYKLLSKELERVSLDSIEELNFKRVNVALQKHLNHTYPDFNGMLTAIGEGALSSLDVVQSLYPSYKLKNLDERWHWSVINFLRPQKPNKASLIWIKVVSTNEPDQARKILNSISEGNVNIIKTEGRLSRRGQKHIMRVLIEIASLEQLSMVCNSIENLDGVMKVERIPHKRQVVFYVSCIVTLLLWGVHPLMIQRLLEYEFRSPILDSVVKYMGLFLIVWVLYILRRFSRKSFPGMKYLKRMWLIGFLVMTVAFMSLVAEIYYFKFELNWIFVFAIITLLYASFTAEYLRYVQSHEHD